MNPKLLAILDTSEGWWILTALRGPDGALDYFPTKSQRPWKFKYTTPIRKWALDTDELPLYMFNDTPSITTLAGWKNLSKIVVAEIDSAPDNEGAYHFLDHINRALKVIIELETPEETPE